MKKFFIFAMFALVSACGFEPLYAQKKPQTTGFYFSGDFDTSVKDHLASIAILPIPDRIGQELRNSLLDSLTPLGQPKNPHYRLEVDKIVEKETEQALRQDITATRIRVKYTAKYKLFDNNYNEILSGDSISYSSFDVLSSPYSSTMSRKKTASETAKILANDITLRLAAYFHSVSAQTKEDDL